MAMIKFEDKKIIIDIPRLMVALVFLFFASIFTLFSTFAWSMGVRYYDMESVKDIDMSVVLVTVITTVAWMFSMLFIWKSYKEERE